MSETTPDFIVRKRSKNIWNGPDVWDVIHAATDNYMLCFDSYADAAEYADELNTKGTTT